MKNKTLFLIVAILAVGLCSAYAGNDNRVGTAGAQELLIPAGSRGTALGGAVIASCRGVDAIYWNPAGLAYLEGTEAMFSHLPYIADIDVEYAAVGTNIEDFGVIGLSVKVVNIGEMEETTERFPDGTGRVFNPTLTVLGLTYAKPLTTNVNFGFTGQFIQENIFEVSATGLAFDFGFTYETRYPGLTLGFVMKNYGPDMEFSGKGFERVYEESGKHPVSSNNAGFELPTSINIGLAYNFLNEGLNSVTVSGNFRGNNQANDAFQGGAEYSYNDRFILRAGYTYADQDGYLYGANLGAGLRYPVGDLHLTFEYTWTETETFDDNQFFTVKAEF